MLTVVNKYTMSKLVLPSTLRVYIGRGSPLGNPWPITKTASRDAVCDQFDEYLREMIQKGDKRICDALNEIAHAVQTYDQVELVCFCAPRRCHGNSIRNTINKALGIK